MLIQHIMSYEDFLNYLHKYKYIIVNISATWCKPCMAIKPQIEKFVTVINEVDYIYLKLDNSIYDEDIKFNHFFNLKKLPYFSFIKNGALVQSFASGDFPIVSKKIFDYITKENIDEKKDFDNFSKNDDF